MVNISTKKIGDFQAKVGEVSANIGLIISYIVAGILIIMAIVLSIMSFIPMKPLDCYVLKKNMDDACLKETSSTMCNDATEKYKEEEKRCSTNTKHTWLLWFLCLIPIAILIVILSKWWKHFVDTNKTAAQIGGTMFEINSLKNIFS